MATRESVQKQIEELQKRFREEEEEEEKKEKK